MGAGAPVLAIHGLGGSGRYWTRLATVLAPHFWMIAPDLPGFGDSDKPDIAYAPELFSRCLDEVQEQLGIHSWHASIGHSLGGVLAVAHAAARPNGPPLLVLCAAPLPGDPAQNERELLRSPLSRYLIRHRRLGRVSHDVGCRVVPLLLWLTRLGQVPREILQDFHKHTHHSYTDTAERCILGYDLRPLLPAISDAQALLAYSRIDADVPLSHAYQYQAAVRRTELRVVRRPHDLVPFGLEEDVLRWLRSFTQR